METTTKAFKIITQEVTLLSKQVDAMSNQADAMEESLDQTAKQVNSIFDSFAMQHRGHRSKPRRDHSR